MVKKFLAAAFALLLATPVFAQVSVQGTGVVYAKPDCAHLSFVVVTEHTHAAKAHAANRDASNSFFGVLKKNGVDDKDVSTSSFNIQPKYSYPKEGDPNLVGYIVAHHLNVKVRDLKDVGGVIDGAVGDTVRLQGISFAISDRDALESKARDLALADAKKRAQQMVSGLGEKLGCLVSVSESVERSVAPYRAMASESARADAPGTRVASGEQAVTVHVSVVFEVSGHHKK